MLAFRSRRSWFVCGNCGQEAHVFGSGGVERTAHEMGLDVLGKIPLHIDIRVTADEGNPIVISQPDSTAAQAYLSVAERVWQKLQALDGMGAPGPPKVVIK